MQLSSKKIVVSVPDQQLYLFEGNDAFPAAAYPISTSAFGLGTELGSLKTPTGHFRIGAKIGHGAEPWSVFKSRLFTGALAIEGGEEDLVLSRILWLEGLEEGNANTWDRYIYIHGTNHETQLGNACSHGCVRMRNTDVIELFDRVAEGDPVEIRA